jgi:hypothetical protein
MRGRKPARVQDLLALNEGSLARFSDEDLQALIGKSLHVLNTDRQENQILYYKPVSRNAMAVHESKAKLVGVGGGNGSSKTETCLVEIVSLATGVFPNSLKHLAKQKFRGPVNCRIVVESLTTVLHPIMLPKLQWFKWTGVDRPGGERGHWGWVPRSSLLGANWDKSWSEKLRTLSVLCRDPKDGTPIGESQIQFLSKDQDPSDFASGDFHIIMHDEPPTLPIFRESQARTMRVNGRLLLAMTWPDDPSIPVDWIFDEIYERGIPGPNKSPDTDWFELATTDNATLDQQAIRAQMEKWSAETINVRIQGKPIRFSNRIHPLFTDTDTTWSFASGHNIFPVNGKDPDTGSPNIVNYNHVVDFEWSRNWPTIFLIDPHPRKPHMFLWVQVDPSDDLWVVAEGAEEGGVEEVAKHVKNVETSFGFRIARRLGDPNMLQSPAGAVRGVTWLDEFRSAGLPLELGNDVDVGRARLNKFLEPDPNTRRPRITIAPRCKSTIFQMKRYAWDEYRRKDERDPKAIARQKYDDYPTLLKYLMNSDPNFDLLYNGAPVIRRRGHRKGGY